MSTSKAPYDLFLSGDRRRVSKVKGRTLEEEADSDRGRVLFCAPFRRLQNKAQVFSLETNAAVRSRLTHSLEVSSIGRYVAQQAFKAIEVRDTNNALGLRGKERPFITFVETACLLHDVGNPPFGHFGEIAIGDWFHLKRREIFPEQDSLGTEFKRHWERYYNDFEHFDGNPQGFRLVTRLQPSVTNDLNGLNLTATTLASLIKYPRSTAELGAVADTTGKRNKAGFFQTEEDVFEWIRGKLGMKKSQRHPLVYLMEAADDIAYCMSDIEDGIEKGVLNAADFANAVKKDLKKFLRESSFSDIKRALDAFKGSGRGERSLTPSPDLRSAVIRLMVKSAADAFAAQQDAICAGDSATLFSPGRERVVLEALKRFASDALYNSPIVRQREITAHKIICGILDAYLPVMDCDRSRFRAIREGQSFDNKERKITIESSLCRRIAGKHFEVYDAAVRASDAMKADGPARDLLERVYRIRLVLDHLSGMTDEFAMQTFQLISGIRLN